MQITAIHTGPVQRALCSMLVICCLAACGNKNKNQLAAATSPYLLQHADNPVEWQQWGPAALLQAEKERKPLLVSVGYAACHWCHVMEEETFMDTAVARLMNDNFVCIKVDREERPDIDNLYSGACQLLTGSAGWPLNAFALPDGKPFFAGTYYSKASWLGLLQQIISAYKNQPGKIKLQAAALADGMASRELSLLTDSTSTVIKPVILKQAFDSMVPQLDMRNGGLSGTTKFPAPYTLEFLMQYYYATGQTTALGFVNTSLLRMALGGINDQAGGGFSRYAVDSNWHIPHFEKMLYDNGQLMSVYAHAYQLTAQPFFKTVLQETAAFVQRELLAPSGGFYSSLNADTRQGEGAFYAWTAQEFQQATKKTSTQLADYYHVTTGGNWNKGRNILYAAETPGEFAHTRNIDSTMFQQELNLFKQQLLSERSSRPAPAVDKKILSAWNALALKGYLDAYAATGEKTYLDIALANAAFLEKNMMNGQGLSWRSYTEGKAGVPAFLEDYAFVCDAFIQLYQLSFNLHWLNLSRTLADQAINTLYDSKTGMFASTGKASAQVVGMQLQLADQSIPSPNAVMGRVLYNLGTLFQQEKYNHIATGMITRMNGQLGTRNAVFYSSWGSLALLLAHGSNEVVITGENAGTENLLLRSHYLPQAVFMGSTSQENLPLLKGKLLPAQTMIYVCSNKTCKKPVSSAAEALLQLNAFNQH